ncbi:hypothetical protein LCGC14_0365890 [marine sediment metagenome]|uniref:Uncharacterized protein n=1 Tax=marine sediment metagenome TaxID=412755 RepID=A0A0F9TPQ1_9ZZZZ
MKRYPHFILRTVHNGRIRFDNEWWIPQEPTDRLNGIRLAFGIYVEGVHTHPVKRLDILCLWGSEEAYHACQREEDEKAFLDADNKSKMLLAPEGFFRQYWWHPVEPPSDTCPEFAEG